MDKLKLVLHNPRRMRKAGLIAVGLIYLALFVWFSDVLFAGRSFYVRDLMRDHYPTKMIVRNAMKSGEFPYWSPFYAGGQPLAANPAYELFYPPQWLILLPSFQLGFTLHIVLHAFLAALGMFLLLRSLGLGVSSSAFGTTAFTFGGLYLSLIRVLPFLFEVSWIPLLLLFTRRWMLQRNRRDLCWAAFFGGMQALVAEPTTLMQTWALIGAYAIYRSLQAKKWAANFGGIIASGIAALLVAAAQFLPAMELAGNSVRARGLDFDYVVSYWSMSPARPLELFFPSFFDSTYTAAGIARMKLMYPGGAAFLASIYLGLAVALLFLAGLIARRKGWLLVLSICVGSYFLAIGSHTPLLRFLYDIGLFRGIRYPEKFAMMAVITIIIWASITLDRLVNGDEEIAKWSVRIAIGWFGFALLNILLSNNLGGEIHYWLRTLLRGAAVLAVLWAMRKRPAPVWAIALSLITLVDVQYLQKELNPTTPANFFDAPAVTRELDPAKDQYRIFHAADWNWAYNEPAALEWFGGTSSHEPWTFIRNGLMPRIPAQYGFQLAPDFDYANVYLLPTTDLITAFRNLRDSKRGGWETTFMAMSNAWYWTRFRSYQAEVQRTHDNPEEMRPVDFIPVTEKNPRFYFADSTEQAGSIDMFVSKMLSKQWSPRVAFIEDEAFTPAAGVVNSVKQSWNSATLDVESQGRALLVASITPEKHWHATIDGKPATLRVANIGYQALEVPAGKHKVVMTYRNPLVIAGIWISVLALAAVLGGGAFER